MAGEALPVDSYSEIEIMEQKELIKTREATMAAEVEALGLVKQV